MSQALNQKMSFQADKTEQFWEAVLMRDASYDGAFVFAVSSTGIYCRPSCAARRPRRERVSFFQSPQAAEQAGFRACLRCRPNEENSYNSDRSLARQACALIDEQEGSIDLSSLGVKIGISAFHLQRVFKREIGITPRQYAQARRIQKFKEGVQAGESVTGAMYDAGFGSSSRLYERADVELGMTPATYARGGAGAVIRYTTTQCSLGCLLVAATAKGICAVRLGDSDVTLTRDLRKEFPLAQLEADEKPLVDWVAKIVKHLEGKQPHLNLPVDIRATAFQRQVWEALRSIPSGSTRSYSEVAESIGKPTAVRAVARACATNPVALVIPCHRVIREDRTLGGYRWGLDRKKKLLQQEQKAKQG